MILGDIDVDTDHSNLDMRKRISVQSHNENNSGRLSV